MPRKKINKEITEASKEPPLSARVKKVQVHVEKPVPRKLIDETVLRKSSSGLSRILAGAAALGFLAGGGIVGYLYFSQEDTDVEPPKEIVVPDLKENTDQGEKETSTTTPDAPTPQSTPKVEVLATPTGYLNVRRGPGTNFEKIGEIKPGEIYDLVSEDRQNGWYEIKLSGGTGWVTKQYARVK